MNRGRRYDAEPKLNKKKVFVVIMAFVVIIMFIFMIKNLLTKDNSTGKIVSKSYYTAYKDNKWGVIDSAGETIIDPSYKEMIVIPNNKVGVFICTYDVNYDTGEYKTKVLNEKNEQIYKEYSKVEAIQNSDSTGKFWYEQSVLRVEKDSKYGLINLSGKEIIPLEYDNIVAISGIENSFKIEKDGKYGIVNNEGKIVIEPKYADIDVLGKDNKSGFIIKGDSGKYGIIDYSNNQILEAKYESVKKIYGNDLYVVTVQGKEKLVNKEGKDILTTGFDEIKQILDNQENGVIFSTNNKYGIMNLSGEVLVKAEYDDLKEAKLGVFIAKKGDKYGVIDISNVEKISFVYNSMVYNEKADIYISEDENYNSNILNSNLEIKVSGILIDLNTDKGYFKMRIQDEYKYYNFKFEEKQEIDIFPNRTLFLSKKDGKYGYVDKNGKVIVDYIYDDAMQQNDYGYVAVKKDGKWGSISNNGVVVQEPTYNLDEYLLIDFIGRWHLGMDINMNYYNQL